MVLVQEKKKIHSSSTGKRAVENEGTMEQQKHSISTNVGLVSALETDLWQMNQLQGPENAILYKT